MKISSSLILATSCYLLSACIDSSDPAPKVVEKPALVQTTAPEKIKRVTSLDGYTDLFARACLDTMPNLFEGAEAVFRAAGFTVDGDTLTDGRASVKVTRNQARRNHGACQLTVLAPQDDELLAGLKREVNARGLAAGEPNGGLLGATYLLKKQKAIISLGRNSRSGPTTITAVKGVRIG